MANSTRQTSTDDKLVNLTESKIVDYIQKVSQSNNGSEKLVPVDIDLSKPLRCQHFSLLEEILKNPLQEFVSTRKPIIGNSEGNVKYIIYKVFIS